MNFYELSVKQKLSYLSLTTFGTEKAVFFVPLKQFNIICLIYFCNRLQIFETSSYVEVSRC